ncbi:DUF7089 family protein [Halorarius litoreus]|uniref:DUF7089 family protein n=1 Tax=Halorarius litoreus TaxID=2962676 RepID=UPI0020CB849A|nr:hypothetical protein [Halorarius litoreus]
MFSHRDLSTELEGVRNAYAPETLVLDVERDFETLDPAVAETLGLLVDRLDPLSYPAEWVPADAPELLSRLASDEFTIGAPGDGGVAWTRQTTPPTVFVKPRLQGSPPAFIDFLVAEALVQVGLEASDPDSPDGPDHPLPEHFLGFFGEQYPALAAATPLSPADTYQLAYALFEAYIGLHTREVFVEWAGDHPALYDQWVDAGERLEPRLTELPSAVARGETGFAEAAEYACSAIKHDLELPAPFAALDTEAYRHHGPTYAVRWAEKTFEKLA